MITWISIFSNILLLAVVVWLLHRRRQMDEVDCKAPRPETVATHIKKKILVVGMDEDTETNLKAGLQSDYDLVFVKSGQQAIHMIEDIKADLVISEYLMQDMGGDELCHAIREDAETCMLPVVFLSSLSYSTDIVYGLEAGAKDFITKPCDMSILKARIGIVLEEPTKGLPDLSKSGAVKETSDLEFLQRLDKVIRAQLSNSELQINDICQEMGMSRTAMFTKIKATTGHCPNDYLRIFRLNESKRLLEAKLWTIAEVAVKVGYNDPKYFSTCFKKQFGFSPSKMMK